MRKSTKLWLTIATSLIALGCVTFTATACAIGWDFKKFSTVTLETNTYEVSDPFQAVSIEVDTEDVTFLPSDNGQCKVVCFEDINVKHSVTVENDTLTVKAQDERKWYDYLTLMGSGNPTITVYLPQTEYTALSIETDTGDVKIPKDFTFDSVTVSGDTNDVECFASVKNTLTVKVTTGDIFLKNLTAGTVDLTTTTGDIELTSVSVENDLKIAVDTGDVELSDVTCKNFISTGDTGDLEMKNVLVTEKMSIERDTGDVDFERCDAGEIFIKTSTGDVEGSLLTEKNFQADSNTGKKHIPDTKVGGKCEIVSSTGDIFITLAVTANE